VPINARIIVATHKNLLEEVQKKTFREDLYYRLYGLPIYIPALRERNGDILLLAKTLVDNFCKENKIDKKVLSPDAQQKLMGYRFPGNVRELKSIVELAAVMSDGETIEAHNITYNSAANVTDLLANGKTLREYTNFIIQHYLDKHDGDVLLVAKLLDIGKSTIYRMIQSKELVLN
jgi:DNA-binding NtrC family response regulator